MEKHLHIVSFTVPYPVLHGGIVDLYYKIIAFHKAGIHIHLHCFTETGYRPDELERNCISVNYYRRKTGLAGVSIGLPYIVSSRKNNRLVENLLRDNHPILLEGIHSTSLINDTRFAGRNIGLRLHNVEYIYYRHLYQSATSFVKKMYYLFESMLLRRYEQKTVNKYSSIFTVSELDRNHYRTNLHASSCIFVPVFTGHSAVSSRAGEGKYCLYHGNLAIDENEKAVIWLIEEVFNQLNIELIVAGRNPSELLIRKINKAGNISLITNPGEGQLQELIGDAQCHVLPSFNATGVKLKLIRALYDGRFCITNKAGAEGSGLEDLCIIADTALAFKSAVETYNIRPFTDDEIHRRSLRLSSVFDNSENVDRIIRKLW